MLGYREQVASAPGGEEVHDVEQVLAADRRRIAEGRAALPQVSSSIGQLLIDSELRAARQAEWERGRAAELEALRQAANATVLSPAAVRAELPPVSADMRTLGLSAVARAASAPTAAMPALKADSLPPPPSAGEATRPMHPLAIVVPPEFRQNQ